MTDDTPDFPEFTSSGCDIMMNLNEISTVMGSLIDKLHGVEAQVFGDKGVQPVDTTNLNGGTSPTYNKWVRLSALYQLLFRSIAAHGASEDDIIMLALGIQMKRSSEFLKATEGLPETEEDEAAPADPVAKSRGEVHIELVTDLRKLRKMTINRIKAGKSYRDFESSVLPQATVDEINKKLRPVTDVDEARAIIKGYMEDYQVNFLADVATLDQGLRGVLNDRS